MVSTMLVPWIPIVFTLFANNFSFFSIVSLASTRTKLESIRKDVSFLGAARYLLVGPAAMGHASGSASSAVGTLRKKASPLLKLRLPRAV